MMADVQSFFENDFPASLFPLRTNQLMMRHHARALSAHVARVHSSAAADRDFCFFPQTKAHAAKPRNHLRRTAVLDPVATFFVYDFIFRNRDCFSRIERSERKAFGYKFESGSPVPVHKAFQDFSSAVASAHDTFEYSLSFDVASYFNTLYHHDLAHWLLGVKGLSSIDADGMARFLREANSGRSIDCLPQGIYPTKMLGSAFLEFVEANGQLRCAQTYRFMDDIYLFDNNEQVLVRDFLLLQKLLGQFALNVNPTKTSYDGSQVSVGRTISEIQAQLDSIIDEEEPRSVRFGSGVEVGWADSSTGEDGEESEEDEEGAGISTVELSSDQIDQLFGLLIDARAEEADVERILGVLLRDTSLLVDAVPVLLRRFPNIVKQLHKLVGLIDDKQLLAEGLLEMLSEDGEELVEYQLFWIAVMAEDHLAATTCFGNILMLLLDLTRDYEIARAKVLEIPDQRFGLKEIRDSILKSGASNWSAWSSAMGTRSLPKAVRNHTLKYFAKGSAVNQLIADCVCNLT